LIDLMAQPIDHKAVLRLYRVDVNHHKGSPAKLTHQLLHQHGARDQHNIADDPVSTWADSKGIGP
jgi:hypothetical protein